MFDLWFLAPALLYNVATSAELVRVIEARTTFLGGNRIVISLDLLKTPGKKYPNDGSYMFVQWEHRKITLNRIPVINYIICVADVFLKHQKPLAYLTILMAKATRVKKV